MADPAPTAIRLVAYNLGQGGSRDPITWQRVLPLLAPDLFFVQESRAPAQSWLAALPTTGTLHWVMVPSGRWGTGLWLRSGQLTPLPVPEEYTGRVAAALVEGLSWPGVGTAPVVALSIHAPTRQGSTYMKEVGLILDYAKTLAAGLPLILAGDFNVAVGLRDPSLRPRLNKGERALLARLADELMMIPCWQTAHPGEPLARTLRWMRRIDSLPYHCDGIFVPASWAPSLQACDVLEDEQWIPLSDHNPVVATFSMP